MSKQIKREWRRSGKVTPLRQWAAEIIDNSRDDNAKPALVIQCSAWFGNKLKAKTKTLHGRGY